MKFLGFAPDLDSSTPGVFTNSEALIPTSDGFFRPQPSLVAYGTAMPATVFGAFEADYLNGSERVFAGTANHLYEQIGGTAGGWTQVDGGTAFTANSQPGGGWRFAVFGNVVIAQDGFDAPVATGVAGNFAAIPAATVDKMPTSRCIASVANNFVMLGNIVTSPDVLFPAAGDRWWACAQGDYTEWTPSISTLCVTGRLLDTPGPITAIKSIGTNITFAMYKNNATYMGIFVGSPVVWQFIRISSIVGAFSQESIADIGNIHIFPSFDDFWTFDGNNIQRLENPLKDYFYTNLNLTAVVNGTSNILAQFDRVKDLVYWYFPTTTTAIDTWICWNIRSNSWTKGTLTVDAVMSPEVPLTPTPFPGMFKSSDHILYTISGSANPLASFTTGNIGDHQHKYFISRLRPKFEVYPSDATSILVDGYTLENLGGTSIQANTSVPMIDPGWVNLRQNGRWSNFKFTLGSDCTIIGMDVEAQNMGNR